MSPWVDPVEIFDLAIGEAYVIRTAGNITPEAIRSIMLAMLADRISDVIVLGHTGCTNGDKGLVFKNLDKFSVKMPPRSYLREMFSTREKALKYLGIFDDEIANIHLQVENLAFLKFIQPGLNVTGMLYNEHNGHVYTLEDLDQFQKISKTDPDLDLDDFVPTRYKDLEKARESEKAPFPAHNDVDKGWNAATSRIKSVGETEEEPAKKTGPAVPGMEVPAEFLGQRLAFEKLMEAMQKSITKVAKVRIFTPKIRMPRVMGVKVEDGEKAPPA